MNLTDELLIQNVLLNSHFQQTDHFQMAICDYANNTICLLFVGNSLLRWNILGKKYCV